MREIVFDTETTGFHAEGDDRLVEIGCLELFNHIPTGREFHVYINPGRPIPMEAQAVHGISDAMVADKPAFAEVAAGFLEFVGDATLIAHNCDFDRRFINAELKRLGFPPLPDRRFVDTLAMARQKYPGSPASLDALCRRFAIDTSARVKHGALLDAQLLAEVYLEFRGGRQPTLVMEAIAATALPGGVAGAAAARPVRPPRPHAASAAELAAHAAFTAKLKNPLWDRFREPAAEQAV